MTKRLLLAAVLVAAMASTALAAAGDPAVQRNGYWWNPTTGAKTDGDGNAYVNPVQNWTYFSKIYSDTLSRNGKTVDSTGVYAVGPYGSGLLFVYPITTGATGDSLMLAVQVRGHFQSSSDSSSTFPLFPFANNPFGTGPGQRDKTGHLGAFGTVPGASAEGTPGFNEYVIVLKPDVDFQNSAAGAPYPGKGFPIPLYNLWTPYFSVRFRNISRTGVTTGVRSRLDITYIGTPLK